MRRFKMILTALVLVSAASLLLVSAAPAGDFADEPCVSAGGDNYLCPPATAGASYELDIKLKEPWPGCTNMTVSSGAFPPGLSLASEGQVRGTPTTPGSYTFYVTVTWSSTAPCVSQSPSDRQFTINVNPQAQRLIVATTGLPDGNIGQAYTAPALSAVNGNVSSWTIAGGALPAGLTLGPNGVISGTPTQSGLFSVVVQANGSPNNDTKQLSLFVLAPLELQTLTGAKPPARGLTAKAAVSAPLATGVKAVGGRGPYTFAAEGVLPPGINLDAATGAITGAGTTAGRYTSSISVTDQAGTKASVSWAFTILPLLDFRKGKGLPVGTVDRRYSAKIPVSGKDARTAQFAVSGQIPPGLELDETTGRLTGILLRVGNYRLRVFAFPETGSPISKVFRIRVRG
jgi:large repetitive protein